jgi:hypothetical protein
MGKKRFTPEQINGKLWEAEVALSAINQRLKPSLTIADMVIIAISHRLPTF